MKSRFIKIMITLTCIISNIFVTLPVFAESNDSPQPRVVISKYVEFTTCNTSMANLPPSISYKNANFGGALLSGTVYRGDRATEAESGGNAGKYCYIYAGTLFGQS